DREAMVRDQLVADDCFNQAPVYRFRSNRVIDVSNVFDGLSRTGTISRMSVPCQCMPTYLRQMLCRFSVVWTARTVAPAATLSRSSMDIRSGSKLIGPNLPGSRSSTMQIPGPSVAV